jgi:hypothetical protein
VSGGAEDHEAPGRSRTDYLDGGSVALYLVSYGRGEDGVREKKRLVGDDPTTSDLASRCSTSVSYSRVLKTKKKEEGGRRRSG